MSNYQDVEVQYFQILLRKYDKTVKFNEEAKNPLFIDSGYGLVEGFEAGMLKQWQHLVSTIGQTMVYRTVPGSFMLSRFLEWDTRFLFLQHSELFFHYSEMAQEYLFKNMYSFDGRNDVKYAIRYENVERDNLEFLVFYSLDSWARVFAEAIKNHILNVLGAERVIKNKAVLDLQLCSPEEIVNAVCESNYFNEHNIDFGKNDKETYTHLEGQFCMFEYGEALNDLMNGYEDYFIKKLASQNRKFKKENTKLFQYYWRCILFYFNSKYDDYGMLQEEDTKMFKYISLLIFNKIAKKEKYDVVQKTKTK